MIVETWPTEFNGTDARVTLLLAKTTLPVGTALAEATTAVTVTGVCKGTDVDESESVVTVGVAMTM